MVCLPLGFCIIGPAATVLSNAINNFFTAINGFSPVLAGAVLAGLWQLLVMFGVHTVLAMTFIAGLMTGVPQPMMGAMGVCSFVQTGAVMAIWLKTKNRKMKDVALPAWISGLFGITEPAIYGVTLPSGNQFALTCFTSAVMGAIAALSGCTMYTMTGMGVFGIFGMINPDNPGATLAMAVINRVLSVAAGFAVAFFTYKEITADKQLVTKKEGTESLVKKEILASPLTGKAIPLTEVEDAAFSGELLGKGIAVDPTDGHVYAPCDGTLSALFPTKHAIGIVTEHGAELLIHLGLDTVKLEGKHFEAHVKAGDKVTKGQLLITCDIDAIKKEGYSMVTPIIVTNTLDYLDIVAMKQGEVVKEEDLLTLIH